MNSNNYIRHKCFISYHHDDEIEVERFIRQFDNNQDVLITRGIGAGMAGDVINSNNDDYIMRRIRELYLKDTTVTIVLVGRYTWTRKFVDWEVAASLRNTPNVNRSGLMAITLPSAANYFDKKLPLRVQDNVDRGYARWWKYPTTAECLASCIETAYKARSECAHLVDNRRPLCSNNSLI
ncbi:TIR domain-containing protein [Propionibacterium acidifaciens]|uniref:TIR domain-containing protein n=1 Tax=Propionibacterium acidifaciens TaxID=556499 RepID=UPI0028E55236|nr:TIR domain-containing protein [Propionibacterium acidifaciens]